jgi:hypothetical protein
VNIGDWVQRIKRIESGAVAGDHEGKVHRVESVVAGEAVTSCGLRMDRETDAGRLTAIIPPLDGSAVCSKCLDDKRHPVRPELAGAVPAPALTPEQEAIAKAGAEAGGEPGAAT